MWQSSWVRPWNWVMSIAELSRKNVFKYDYLQSWEISSNTGLLDFGLTKSDLRLSSWPKVKFEEHFPNIFYFTLPFFQALFKRWISNKLKVILVTFTSYSIVLYYTQFNETLWDHGGSNPLEKPWISNPKTERWLMSSVKSRVVGNMHVFMHAWLVKLMFWISNLFFYLVEITRYQKHHCVNHIYWRFTNI